MLNSYMYGKIHLGKPGKANSTKLKRISEKIRKK